MTETTPPQQSDMAILFICKGNWFRSQVAEALYNARTNSKDAISAGTYAGSLDEPEGQVLRDLYPDETFFRVMDTHGFDLREKHTRKLTPQLLAECEIAVSMAEEPYVPDFLRHSKKVEWWDVPNPSAVDTESVERTYSLIERHVEAFLKRSRG